MQVVPHSVAATAQAWDEQSLDLAAAAGQVSGTGTAGFTSTVTGAASRFLTEWQRHTEALGAEAEAQADCLRSAIRDYVLGDEVVGGDVTVLGHYLAELR